MWQIEDTKKLDRHTLKGSFSLVIGPMKIEGWTFHVKNSKSWVSPPSKEYFDRETNEKKYYPMIRFPQKERYWDFQKWAVAQVAEIFSPQQADQKEAVNAEDIPF